MPATGTPTPWTDGSAQRPDEATTFGSTERGMSRSFSSSSSQSPRWMSKSIVRLAFDACVPGAEGKLAAPRPPARIRHVIEQPLELGAGEVRIDHQPGLARDERSVPGV